MIYDTLDNALNFQYSLNDLTAVYAVRGSEHNPWVLDRIRLIKKYYDPLPHVLIVDFGSEEKFSNEIKNICEDSGFEYNFVKDDGVFSAAIARNFGFSFVKTKLVFFNDIDCFSGPDLFSDLIRASNDFELSKYFDRMMNLPVYHLTESVTDKITNSISDDSRVVVKAINNSIFTKRWSGCEFIAPYSNVFLCRTDFFSYLGGYDEKFRGHGSEDFEFLIRCCIYTARYPEPAEFEKDFYAPTRDSFYKDLKRYKGFRRVFELLSFEAEVHGLKVAHLHHSKPESMPWVKNNDWKRNIFSEAVAVYLNNRKELVNLDWLPRRKKLLALVKHEDHYNYLFPLRNAGYKIECFDLSDKVNQVEVIKKMDAGFYDAVCMFNPYMKSHADLYLYFSYAINKGIKPIVIERGALPESWYYAEDMAYVDTDYDNLNLSDISIPEGGVVDELISRIKSGGITLESNGSFDETYFKYRLLLSVNTKKKIFVPLQLSDDSAVTRFVGELVGYDKYIRNLEKSFLENEDVIFLVKKHPLSKVDDFSGKLPKNVFICDDSDNVHALIEMSDAVVCYNSGVGLLALIHEKPVFTIGRSFYSKSNLNLGCAVSLPEVAVNIIKDNGYKASGDFKKFVSWLVFSKYSFYKSSSVIRDFGDRKSHGYKNSRFYCVNYEGFSLASKHVSLDYPFSSFSYGAAKLNICLGVDQHEKDVSGQKNEISNQAHSGSSAPGDVNEKNKKSTSMRKFRKLIRNPKAFFADSKNPLLRKFSVLF